jgi:hypothetical protein
MNDEMKGRLDLMALLHGEPGAMAEITTRYDLMIAIAKAAYKQRSDQTIAAVHQTPTECRKAGIDPLVVVENLGERNTSSPATNMRKDSMARMNDPMSVLSSRSRLRK